MKFLCDRCKTRYSIGDDRVRGKILKIRCKNCANVITVREGMTVDDAIASDRNRPTTAAPLTNAAPANGALASAFANQLTKPPPALEEEWYVSIDGDQSGPYSLSDAQRWISNKAFDADVHCWSEGFDDWLPVDKVSHFRGLRKKPAPPTAPPPLPRGAPGRTGPAAALQQARPEDLSEPKPLFAATMASIERAAGIPPSPQTPPHGVVAKANGTGSASVPRLTDNGRAKSPAIPSTIAVNKYGSGSNRPSTVQGLGQSAGAKALAAAFDASETAAATATVEAPAFPPKPVLASVPAPEPESNGAPPEDDELDIGEVSRVVNLADLMKAGNAQRKNSRAPVASMRATGSTPKLDAASLGISVGAGVTAPASLEALEPAVAAPVVAQAHRRGLIMLIGVAAVLLIGVAVLVVVMVQRTDDGDANGGLAQNHAIDTSRPEDLVFRQLPNERSGSAAAQKPLVPIHRPTIIHTPIGGSEDGGDGKGDSLKSDEIEDMARKQSAGTQRCYMRAQRGAEGIEIADLKKLSVTMTVDKTGVVTDVALNEHGADTLGQCLIGQIKRWKFRESPGGLYRIILAFAS
ncbi:MAG: GYF domain-containing protein [Kofleriaceae bacterium]